jgi:H+/gluconate symporter and related permeases
MDSSVMISFIGIIVGVIFFIFISAKGLNLTISAGLGAVLILLFSGVNLVTGLNEFWITGLSNASRSYIMIFVLGGIFGKLFDQGGGARRIAFSLLRVLRKNEKNKKLFACYFLVLMYFILTYVGIHGFIIVFTVLAIGRELAVELDIPWRFYCYGSGGILPGYFLAGSLSSVNAKSMDLTGTTAVSGALLSIIMAVIFFAVHIIIVRADIAKSERKGEGFMDTGAEIHKAQIASVTESDDLPALGLALIPLVVMLVVAATGAAIMTALTVGIVLCLVCFHKSLMNKAILSTISGGAVAVFPSLINVCGCAALGTVVRSVAGYAVIEATLGSFSAMTAGIALTMFGTAILGSSTSSMAAFGPQYVGFYTEAGLSAASQNRIISLAANFYPPHNPGVVNAASTAKIPYKSAAWIYFKGSFFPTVAALVVTLILVAVGVF